MRKRIAVSMLILMTLVLLTGCAEESASISEESGISGAEASEIPGPERTEGSAHDRKDDVRDNHEEDQSAEMTANAAVKINYAEKELLFNHDIAAEYVDDESEYQVKVVFSTDAVVKNVKFLELGFSDENDELKLNVEKELYVLNELSPDSVFIVYMAFQGIIPDRGISYVDQDGTVRYYAVEMSGKDGSLLMTEMQGAD